ncbi:uncharacterized protein LOC126843550 [Adelges cooleyi]|uniref:uncharacterized protein LOC126843550 n=1 Tax=Adelges cooleyi TaxID=133065 RepID=UPI00217FF2D1|nr:uncharacterized protein LOC126843550 [Adelges cooleyi]
MALSAASCFLTAVAFAWCVSAGDPVNTNNNNNGNNINIVLPSNDGINDSGSADGIVNNDTAGLPATITVFNSSSTDRDSRFLSFAPGSGDANTLQEKQDDTASDPGAHLVGIYTDCLFQLSFPCVQRKLLLFLDKLGRMKGFSVLGDILSVVRIKRDIKPPLNETDLMARLNNVDEQSAVSALMEHTMDRFIGNHVLRIALPAGITAALKGKGRAMPGNTLDINLSRALGEGRGKKKQHKKMMQMLMMGLMAKMALMGPLMMLLIKVKAIKALLLSKLALLLSLGSMMKGKKSGGGSAGKEVIIVHDNHGAGAEYGAGTAAGWVSGHTATGWSTGGGADSYSAGSHLGGGDNTYGGGAADSYSSGAGAASGWGGVNSHSAGWGRKAAMVHEPHWVAYRAYIPTAEDDHTTEK